MLYKQEIWCLNSTKVYIHSFNLEYYNTKVYYIINESNLLT